MKIFILALFWAASTRAAESPAMKTYIYMKQDSGIYLGEGVAALKDFGGDRLKARDAAKERARGDLASNVSVEIKSETSEKLESKGGQLSEELKSQNSSKAEIRLDNLKYVELNDYPDPGQVTVLASLSKEDYRRQLAGKAVGVYAPENGFRIALGVKDGANIGNVGDPATAHFWGPGGSIYSVIGMEFLRNGWVAGLEAENSSHNDSIRQDNSWDPTTKAYSNFSPGYSFFVLSLGRDLTPWKVRRQIYFPLRLQYAYTHIEPFNGLNLFGGSAGLGYRFWPTDGLALSLQVLWTQGFNSASLVRADGSHLLSSPGSDASLDLTGMESTFGITWSGF